MIPSALVDLDQIIASLPVAFADARACVLTDKTFTERAQEKAPEALPHKGSRGFTARGTSVGIKTPQPLPSVSPVSTPSPTKPKRRKTYKLLDPTTPKTLLHLRRKRKLGLKPWRRLNRAEAFVMWDRAIAAMGERVAFTLNLRRDREPFYRSRTRTASSILKDITRHLEREFGREIPVALSLEETDEGRLHAHGIAGVSKDEAERFRRACRLGVGEWEENRQFQCDTDPEIDPFWAGYCMKRRHDPKLSLDATTLPGRFRKLGINGSFVAATVDVRRKSKDLYKEARSVFEVEDKSLVTYPSEIDLDNLEEPLEVPKPLNHNRPAYTHRTFRDASRLPPRPTRRALPRARQHPLRRSHGELRRSGPRCPLRGPGCDFHCPRRRRLRDAVQRRRPRCRARAPPSRLTTSIARSSLDSPAVSRD